MKNWLLITCEHGGNRVPRRYGHLFRRWGRRLGSHRGFDFGALRMAREISEYFDAPLVASTVTRLLVDLNRSVGHRDISRVSREMSPVERERMLRDCYRPYRAEVERWVAKAIGRGHRVVHISSHSFTPRLHGKVRLADVGLLYDPVRPGESALCQHWKAAISRVAPELRVRRNYPYYGKGDGLTSHLRLLHSPDAYIGVELEINQALVTGTKGRWTRLRASVIEALRITLESQSAPVKARAAAPPGDRAHAT